MTVFLFETKISKGIFMNSDDKFWVAISFFGFTLILTAIYAISDYQKDHNAKIVELIKSGTPPVEAMCAMQGDYGRDPTCVITATKLAVSNRGN